MPDPVELIRSIVNDNIGPGSPIGSALLAAADALDGHRRGLDAHSEQIDDLQEQVREAAVAAGVPQDPPDLSF